MQKFSSFMNRLWYTRSWWRWLFWPISSIYQWISYGRRYYFERFKQQQFAVPVIVVGNLTVGGVGKTPLVIALAQQLQARGMRVGIVSRGYGAKVSRFPHEVRVDDSAVWVGDEPLLLAQKTQCPVVIATKRVQAVQYLLDRHKSQVVLSDDGLQHYAMGRAIEIVVIDGTRGFGNGLCLPAGPLREKIQRLRDVDYIVLNGGDENPELLKLCAAYNPTIFRMELIAGELTQLINRQTVPLKQINSSLAAVAAIGNPKRFFATLEALKLVFKPYVFKDHHQFKPSDLQLPEKKIVMTEKDAVKCFSFATEAMYFLPVVAKLSDKFWETLWSHKQLR